MAEKRILLFGGNGQLGQALHHMRLPVHWHMHAPARAECDIEETGQIAKTMRGFRPNLVVNAAALADVDSCERDPDRARRVNFEAVAAIAAFCTEMDAPLVQVSTDYVFDGADKTPYGPYAAMNPVNVYGQSKMMGEEAARHGTPWHVILRTAFVFGPYGNNALIRMLRQIDAQEEVAAPDDQICCPTSSDALAEGIVRIADAILGGKVNGFGTFHLCGAPQASRFGFLEAVMEAYAPFAAKKPRLIPVRAAEMPNRTPRPLYSALDCGRLEQIYGIAQRPWKADLARAVERLAAPRGGCDSAGKRA